MSFGEPHHHFDSIDSTNTRARELAAEGAEHGTVVTADEQTAGRGRQGRTWTAPPGKALLYSAIVRPLDDRHLMLPLAVPLAVCEAAEELARDLVQGDKAPGFHCGVKWPNDVLVDGRKVAGILAEARPQAGWAVLGIGLNVAVRLGDLPAELRDTAGTLGLGPADVEPVLARLLGELDAALALAPDALLAAYRERDALAGRAVTWAGGRGAAVGIDADGRLLVDLDGGGRTALDAGEVHLTR